MRLPQRVSNKTSWSLSTTHSIKHTLSMTNTHTPPYIHEALAYLLAQTFCADNLHLCDCKLHCRLHGAGVSTRIAANAAVRAWHFGCVCCVCFVLSSSSVMEFVALTFQCHPSAVVSVTGPAFKCHRHATANYNLCFALTHPLYNTLTCSAHVNRPHKHTHTLKHLNITSWLPAPMCRIALARDRL